MADKPGLLTVAMSAIAGTGVFFQRPTRIPALRHLRQLGLALVDPKGGTDNRAAIGYELEKVGFGLANKYPADLILLNHRPGFMSRDDLVTIPTWQAQPQCRLARLSRFAALEAPATAQRRGHRADHRCGETCKPNMVS